MDYPTAVSLIETEFAEATEEFGPFVDNHQGYAIILEELDELWDEIKKKHPSNEALKAEAKQVAAMALRFLVDCCE